MHRILEKWTDCLTLGTEPAAETVDDFERALADAPDERSLQKFLASFPMLLAPLAPIGGSKAWFNDFVERSLVQYGNVYIIQPYREQEKCSPACQNAVGHECQCSCMGLYHGAGNDGSWFEVSGTFATRWGSQELACRLMTAK
jgi:hypothetical protein